MTAVGRSLKYSKASVERMLAMQHALHMLDAEGIAGDIVECGVWRGGHIILARLLSPNRVCWLYDTFTGMTAPGPHDRKRSGDKPPPEKALSKKWTMASLEEVRENLRIEGVYDESKLRFVVGDVCETLSQPENLPDHISVLRLDTDWYESTKEELEVLWPRLVTGGYLIIDDYGHWLGSRKATQEYFNKHYPSYVTELKPVDYTASIMRKK